jgi:UDP-N-acetylmuramoyl-L-alanyl-D-glutamate--2,6-diaminopimelate ligase
MERMIKLKKLIKDFPDLVVKNPKEVEITGLTNDSRQVAPGNLFIAKKGLTDDGARFIPDAIAAGAVAFLTDIYDPFFSQIPQIIHPDIPAIEAQLAQVFYDRSDEQLFLIGVTGTNGKTTVTYLIKHILPHCGLIGSIERIVGQHVFPSPQNTPDLITNYKLFHEMALNQCRSCVMEVTSHGIEQGRIRSIEFDVGIFTNLTQDHLDYHKTMEAYADVKASFFSSLRSQTSMMRKPQFPKVAIVNVDDPWYPRMIAECPVSVLTYGIDHPCDVRAENLILSSSGIQFTVHYQQQQCLFTVPLIGRFNVYNCLAAISLGLVREFSLEQIAAALATFLKVPGRLERVVNAQGINIFVDYAHTDDALKNVLQTLRECTTARLITVFGCGGSRDPLKRPKMGAIAEEFSDVAIVTTDNPRKEDPSEIIKQVLSGFKEPQKALVSLDRREAIHRAVKLATPQDIILIAGKGHEDYQIFSNDTIAFDDRLVAQEACTKV